MHIKFLTSAVAIMLTGITCFAQNPEPAILEDFKQPGQLYPQVNSQGYVRL